MKKKTKNKKQIKSPWQVREDFKEAARTKISPLLLTYPHLRGDDEQSKSSLRKCPVQGVNISLLHFTNFIDGVEAEIQWSTNTYHMRARMNSLGFLNWNTPMKFCVGLSWRRGGIKMFNYCCHSMFYAL